VAGGEAAETVGHEAGVGVGADVGGNENPMGVEGASVVGDDVVCVVVKVGLATVEQIRAGLAEEILHALSEEEGEGKTKPKTHISSCKL